MRSSSLVAAAVAFGLASAWASAASADPPQGFAVERFYPSSPGGGWFVMDALDMRGKIGGDVALTGSYAYRPLRLATTDGSSRFDLVAHEAFVDVGFAVTFDRFRLSLDLTNPLVVRGDDGAVGPYAYTAPHVDVGHNPDLVTDPRIGFDARLLGDATGPFRLGASVQLVFPNGDRDDYVTDATFRAVTRVLFAGDVGRLAYAGHVGVHVRPLDDSPTPGSPQGSELLFGLAAGPKLPVTASGSHVLVVGPEVFGETAFQSFFGATTTGVEALLGARVEGTGGEGPQLRVKLGTGGGLSAHFGAPEWRAVFGIEVFDRGERR